MDLATILKNENINIAEIISKYHYSLSDILKAIRENHDIDNRRQLLLASFEYLKKYVSVENIVNDIASFIGNDLLLEALEYSARRLDS